ncbi:MAG TPA: molecular chaperone DnaK, partial [bacterium]|nr:molecular chaperone DnaK [bacterium]
KTKDGDDIELLKKQMEEINQLAQTIGAAMYQAQPDASTNETTNTDSTSQEAKKDEPVEGEIEENK